MLTVIIYLVVSCALIGVPAYVLSVRLTSGKKASTFKAGFSSISRALVSIALIAAVLIAILLLVTLGKPGGEGVGFLIVFILLPAAVVSFVFLCVVLAFKGSRKPWKTLALMSFVLGLPLLIYFARRQYADPKTLCDRNHYLNINCFSKLARNRSDISICQLSSDPKDCLKSVCLRSPSDKREGLGFSTNCRY